MNSSCADNTQRARQPTRCAEAHKTNVFLCSRAYAANISGFRARLLQKSSCTYSCSYACQAHNTRRRLGEKPQPRGERWGGAGGRAHLGIICFVIVTVASLLRQDGSAAVGPMPQNVCTGWAAGAQGVGVAGAVRARIRFRFRLPLSCLFVLLRNKNGQV